MKKIHLLIVCHFIFVQIASTHGLPGSQPTKHPQHATAAITGSPAIGVVVVGGTGRGSAPNQLNEPNNFFFDPAGNLYVADLGNNRIQKFAPGSTTGITVAGGNGYGPASNQLAWPTDVRMDALGNLYITDEMNNRVQKWAPGATTGITVAGGTGIGAAANQLNHPAGLWIDAAGNLYVSDQYNNRIQKFAPGATSGVTVAGRADGVGGSAADQLLGPNDIFIDASGNIFVADDYNHRIQKWAPGATSGVTVAGGNGFGDADNQLNHSDGIFVDPSGNMYISDYGNNRVVKWTLGASSGVTVAGGNGAGPAANQLNGPVNVFVDARGNLYVSEAYNDRILKFAADPLTSCSPDLRFTAPSCNATAVITWTAPRDSFPATINIPNELDPSGGALTYMGALNGHGYYKSTFVYPWPVAKDISFYIGDTSVNGHLITITSAAENNFIFNQIKGTGYSPWIGFYNTGKQGQFSWVTGESAGYTNWTPNEPNNYMGSSRFIKEPYVRLTDGYGTWNDQRSDNVPFIAEFEEPLIRYKQISGPANGSAQSPGTYQVCYEITNHITDQRETCCFNVTVTCNGAAANNAGSAFNAIDQQSAQYSVGKSLSVATAPNPSSSNFRFRIESTKHNEAINVQVTDISGKIVESRKGIMPKQTLEIGMRYQPGVYFAQVIQGTQKVVVKIIKQ